MPKTADHRTHLVLENYIAGKFVPSSRHIDSYDPSTGEVYCKVPDSGKEEVELAVTAAKEAFPAWAARSPSDRAQVLHKLADLIEAHLEEFAQAESRDQGKTITFARTVDIPRSAYNFRFFATSVLHHTTECSQQDHLSCITYTIRSPVGVAGLISPWNLPLYLLTWKIAPAIAVGNTVVAKPSEMTSVTAWMMCKLLEEAGVPPGVVNIVFGTGPGAGDALVSHPEVPVISFTGSTATAQIITERSAPFCKRLSLELGGKNPAIIFHDADLEECIQTTVRSSFSNQGEICLCTSRIFVERSLYPEFLKRFVAAAQLWKTGAPCDSGNNNGALISREHLDKEMLFALLGPNVLWQGSRPPVLDSYCPEDFLSYLASGEPHWFSGEYQEQVWLIRSQVRGYVKLAVSEGAQVHCGEGVDTLELPDRHRGGYFMAPTVLTGVEDTSRCMQEEIFGPVTCITPFDSEEEVIGRANGVRYGLAAVVWSRDVSRVHRVTRRLQAGLVWSNCWLVRDLNMPFGGMKCSGVGREGGRDSYHFFTEVKTITVKH